MRSRPLTGQPPAAVSVSSRRLLPRRRQFPIGLPSALRERSPMSPRPSGWWQPPTSKSVSLMWPCIRPLTISASEIELANRQLVQLASRFLVRRPSLAQDAVRRRRGGRWWTCRSPLLTSLPPINRQTVLTALQQVEDNLSTLADPRAGGGGQERAVEGSRRSLTRDCAYRGRRVSYLQVLHRRLSRWRTREPPSPFQPAHGPRACC